jgi:F-type H+-transporting ATPase subunit b
VNPSATRWPAILVGGGAWVSSMLGPVASWAQHGELPPGESHAIAEHAPSIMNVDPGLMIWTVITFVVLLVVLRFTAWKPLLASLDARERRIREAVEGAERARQESEALLVRHREMLDMAKEEAHQIIEEGKTDGLKLKHEITAHARTEAETLRARSLKEIELATDQAKKELFVHATQLSVELAERILRRTLDGAEQRRLIERVLEEYRGEKKQN